MQTPEDWDNRYRNDDTPWDYGGSQPEVPVFLKNHPEIKKLLIPGCGKGHDVQTAHRAGIDVTCVELSREAAKQTAEKLGPGNAKIIIGDFFEQNFPPASFDAVFERTFLCAIHPGLRTEYVRRIHSLLKPNGFLFGFFFIGEEEDPPPWPLRNGEAKKLFGSAFKLTESAKSNAPLPRFIGAEHWLVWQKM